MELGKRYNWPRQPVPGGSAVLKQASRPHTKAQSKDMANDTFHMLMTSLLITGRHWLMK